MPERPTGTVTFLFTDIEGSTRLLQQLRDQYGDVLSRHGEILRAAFADHDGHEIDTQGDAFFAAFGRARDAVAAAVAAQRAFAAEPWPYGTVVRVRMGLHTGEPLEGGERYVGLGVNRGARICAAGHGGQVLLSNSSRELVEDELPDDVHLRGLGDHELKDIKRPERIFQLEIDGLPSTFPPLRTAQAPAFEGRENELARAAAGITRGRLRPRRAGLVAAAAALIVAAVVIPLVALGGTAQKAVAANSVVALDTTGSIRSVVGVGARPAAVASSPDALWVANLGDENVTHVDPVAGQVVRAVPIGNAPVGLAGTRSGVWVTDGTGEVSLIDPTYHSLSPKWSASKVGSDYYAPTTVRPTLAAFRSIWVVDPDGYVTRIDPASGRPMGRVDVGNSPSSIAAGADSVWVTNSADGTVTRIDPTTLLATPIPVGHDPTAIAVNSAGAWITDAADNTLVRVDTQTNTADGSTRVGASPVAVLATASALWVANAGDGTVMRLDPRRGKPNKTIHLGGTPNALASAGGRVWVTIAPGPLPPPVSGGVVRFTAQNDFVSLDPAVGPIDPRIEYATCANLVTYADKAGPDGARVVPEVAEAVPTPTDGGRIYRFTIRPGYRFSPPSNAPVTASTFKATIERVTDPRMKSPFANAFSGVVGYNQYISGKARGLAGVVARGQTLNIRLTRPDGAFLASLAEGVACVVPVGTPAKQGIDDIPSAGPYYIASYAPRQQLILRRNPNYHGDRPHHLDEIVYTIGIDPSRAVQEIEAGNADYAVDGLPATAATTLPAEYGPGSQAAKAGHQQYFISPASGIRYLHMNTSRPLFADSRLRRAVNYAIDRRALFAQEQKFPVSVFSGGPPTSDYLAPSIAGARDFHLYPLTPDLRRAKQLAGHRHATAMLYAPSLPPWPQESQIIRNDLKPLGIDVQIKEFPVNWFFGRLPDRRHEPYDLAVSGWSIGLDPAEWLDLFGGRRLGQRYGGGSFSHFDNPSFDRRLQAAEKLSGTSRLRAFGRLELDLERYAPVAAIATTASEDFFSARIGCQLYQPYYGIDLGALCLRR